MNIALSPKNSGPSFIFLFSVILIAAVLGLAAVYFFWVRNNTIYAFWLVIANILSMFFFWLAWPDSLPVLILNHKGIYDRRLGVGLILWDDIEDAQLLDTRNNKQYISLQVRDPEHYISRLSGPKLRNMRYNQNLGFTKFNIAVGNFDINTVELLRHIRKTAQLSRSYRT